MTTATGLTAIVDPVISMVPQPALQAALRNAFANERTAVATVEKFFATLPTARWSDDLLRTIACSWKATHLKMLAIYGLCCRLNRLAADVGPAQRDALYVASARNAATSHEDLGLDYDAHTHAELYDSFAGALVGDDSWTVSRYRLAPAHQFSRWVYRNMVVEEIEEGLLTNMFSEIYNHGEYSLALDGFARYFEQHTALSAEARKQALVYVQAHVEDDTEAGHFLVVVEALDRYREATGRSFDPVRAEDLFRRYLRGIAPVMQGLLDRMAFELGGKAQAA